MGLFKKRENKKFALSNPKKFEETSEEDFGELPKLPKLPGLPELPEESERTLPRLPEYSTNTIDDEFSKNTLKKAISGKKEEMFGADEFVREQMMPEHSEIKSNKLEFPYKTENQKNFESRSWTEPSDFAREKLFINNERGREPKTKKSGQVFIKIDKFEESLKIFELTKNKIIEMEKMLDDIKSLKEKEERELSYWMAEIQTIKNQTEKVERDIFSKLE